MENTINLKKIIKIVIPSICMMVFLSFYTIVDGAFVSQFVGTDALSAINITYPYLNIVIGISIMLGTGGCAIVMKKVGEGNIEEAKRNFSLIIYFSITISIIFTIISCIFINNIIFFLGSTESLYYLCYDYLFYSILFIMPTILKFIVEQFLIAINKSNIALYLSFCGGILNIILDYIFIVKLQLGIMGAALATGIGYAVPAFLGLLFFISRDNILYFCKPILDYKIILKSAYNGSSEMISQVSSGIITFLFNFIMLKYVGTDGVASISIILYIQVVVISLFMGYSIGISPNISYFYGQQNHNNLKNILTISYKLVSFLSIFIYIFTVLFSDFLVSLFVKRNTVLFDMTIQGLNIFAIQFLMFGINVFTSNMFTSFSNGKVSAIISFVRSFFESINIIVLPIIFNIFGQVILGIWLAVPLAQIFGVIVSIYFYRKYKNIYGY